MPQSTHSRLGQRSSGGATDAAGRATVASGAPRNHREPWAGAILRRVTAPPLSPSRWDGAIPPPSFPREPQSSRRRPVARTAGSRGRNPVANWEPLPSAAPQDGVSCGPPQPESAAPFPDLEGGRAAGEGGRGVCEVHEQGGSRSGRGLGSPTPHLRARSSGSTYFLTGGRFLAVDGCECWWRRWFLVEPSSA